MMDESSFSCPFACEAMAGKNNRTMVTGIFMAFQVSAGEAGRKIFQDEIMKEVADPSCNTHPWRKSGMNGLCP
jgi:hypothetical protein